MTTPLDDRGREALDYLLSIGVTPAEYRRAYDLHWRCEQMYRIGDVLIEIDHDRDLVTLIRDPSPRTAGFSERWAGTFAEAADMLWRCVVQRNGPPQAGDISLYLKELRAERAEEVEL